VATMYIKRCGSGSAGVCERAEQRSMSIYYAVAVKKAGNNQGTFTTKVVKSVFVLLATEGHNILYCDWGEKILRRSEHRAEFTSVYCAQKRTCYFCTVT